MRCERNRVDGAADQVDAGAGALDREREPVPAGALREEADRKARELLELGDQLAGAVRLQEPGRVVEHDPGGADLGKLLRRLGEGVVAGRAVQQAGVELAAGVDHRLGGNAEVFGVVERIVEAERVDSALGGAGHEPADEVVADRPRADEEAAPDSQDERGLRARADRPDALPGALDAAAHRGVEGASPRDLEIGVTGLVEDLGQAKQVRGRHGAGERLLREDANRGVDEPRHRRGP